MATGALQPTHTIARDQKRAMNEARGMSHTENIAPMTLQASDQVAEVKEKIYVYNILDLEHLVEQPPLFPHFVVPRCFRGQKFSYTLLPRFVNESKQPAGTFEVQYRVVDGRKVATSLLNPAAFPGTDWNAQVTDWQSVDQFGNNLNAFGVWWSLKTPDEPGLDDEIAQFRKVVANTMNSLIRRAEELAASNQHKDISPRMHFAMDYLGKQAPWHMTMRHMIICPNCGDNIPEGISYHRNSFGDRCIVDRERYLASVESAGTPVKQTGANEAPAPEAPKPKKGSKAKAA